MDFTNERDAQNWIQSIQTGVTPKTADDNFKGNPTITSYSESANNPANQIVDKNEVMASMTNSVGAVIKEQIKSSDIYRNIFGEDAPDANRLHQSTIIGDALGIPAQNIATNQELFELSLGEYNRQRETAFLQGQSFSPQTLKELYPELADYAESDAAATTLALKNYQDILAQRKITEAVDAITNIPTVAGNGWVSGLGSTEIAEAGNQLQVAVDEGDAEKEQMLWRRIEELNKLQQGNQQPDDFFGQMVHGVSQFAGQMVGMAPEVLRGASVGMATGAGIGASAFGAGAIPGAIAGFGYGFTGGVAKGVYDLERGSQYIEERQAGMSHDAASVASTITGVGNAAIEMVSFGAVGRLTGIIGKPLVGNLLGNMAVNSIVSKAAQALTTPTMGKIITSTAVKSLLAAAPETIEEGLQQANGMITHNAVVWATGQDVELYSAADIASEGVEMSIATIPTALGLGIIGGAVGTVKQLHNINKEAVIADNARVQYQAVKKNVLGDIMEDNLAQDFKTNNLAAQMPEKYNQTLQKQADKAGFGDQYIDVEMAMNTDSGRQAINQLVDNGLLTQIQIENSIATNTPAIMRTGEFASTLFSDSMATTRESIKPFRSWTSEGLSVARREWLSERMGQVNKDREMRNKQSTETVADNLVSDYFAEQTKDQQSLAKEIIATDTSNVQGVFNDRLNTAEQEYRTLSGETRTKLNKEANNVTIDGGIVPENAPQWYRDFYQQNNRVPTARDIDAIAFEMEAQNAPKERIDALQGQLSTIQNLDAIRANIEKIETPDVRAREGLTPEGYAHYKDVVSTMQQGGNYQVQKTAPESALLFMSHAELFTEQKQALGYDYTLQDYMDSHKVKTGQQLNADYNQGKDSIRGQMYTRNAGLSTEERIINLLETADASTMVHEMGHMFLEDLRELSVDEKATEQMKSDWNAVKEWNGYKEGGTVEENRTAHEMWAEGFENYISTGKAPTQQLARTFRKFASWLTSLWQKLTRAGFVTPEKVPENIREIMGRQLASQSSINAYMEEMDFDAWKRNGILEDMPESTKLELAEWTEKVRDRASAQVLRENIDELKKQNRKAFNVEVADAVNAYKESLIKADESRSYLLQSKYMETPESERKALLRVFDYTEAMYNDDLIRIGNLEEKLSDFETNYRKTQKNSLKSMAELKSDAEKILAGPEGQAKITAIEMSELSRRAAKIESDMLRTSQKIDGLYNDMASGGFADVKAVESVLSEFKNNSNTSITKALSTLKEAKNTVDMENAINAIRSEIRNTQAGLRQVRDANLGQQIKTKRAAEEMLDTMTVRDNRRFNEHQQRAIMTGRKADKAIAKKEWGIASYYKKQQLQHLLLARITRDRDVIINRQVNHMKDLSKRLYRQKNPVKIGAQERYFLGHMLYNMGIATKDGRIASDFDLNNIRVLLDPDYIAGRPESDPIPMAAFGVFNGKADLREVTFSDYMDIYGIIKTIETVGKREYEGSTIVSDNLENVSFDQAAMELSLDIRAISDNPQSMNDLLEGGMTRDEYDRRRNNWERFKDFTGAQLLAISKAETLFDRMGPSFKRYLYNPIERAVANERSRMEIAAKDLRNVTKIYSDKELGQMRYERKYQVGENTKYTKEEVIAMALNYGNEGNRQRMADGNNLSSEALEQAFTEYMTKKDWDFVEQTWALLDGYWAERSQVEERLNGMPLAKVEPTPFSIIVDGKERKISGGYYPIKYDASYSVRATEQTQSDIARKSVGGRATLGAGMGATKGRQTRIANRPLDLSIDVIPRAVTESVHHIAVREAVTDVYKLINRKDVSDAIINARGMKEYRYIQKWAESAWQNDIELNNWGEKMFNSLRRNTSMAIISHRLSTAMLNVTNIFPMMFEHGAINSWRAIGETYATPKTYMETREFVFANSAMMRQRSQNIDRDMRQGLSIGGKGLDVLSVDAGGNTRMARQAKEAINKHGYDLITETDFMLSIPLWNDTYKTAMRDGMNHGITNIKALEDRAVLAADAKVRKVFSSGDAKDLVPMQRSSYMSALAPFYAYMSTVTNALIESGYRAKFGSFGEKMRFINSMLFWIVLPSMASTFLRDFAKGDNPEDDWWAKVVNESAGALTGGVPILRDVVPSLIDVATGQYVFGAKFMPMQIADKLILAGQTAGNDKKTAIDTGRILSQVTNRATGSSDTVSDAFWTMAQFFSGDTDATFKEALWKAIADQKLDKKGTKKKGAKKEATSL